MRALAIGGTTDHVHTLISLPATLSLAKSNSIDKRRIVEMASRSVYRVSEVRVAGRIRRVQRQRFTSQECRQLHQRSEGAPSEEDLRRRILGVSRSVRSRVRPALRLSIIQSSASRTPKPFTTLISAINRWAIITPSASRTQSCQPRFVKPRAVCYRFDF